MGNTFLGRIATAIISLGITLHSSLSFGQGPLFIPNTVNGTYMDAQAIGTLDLTRDGSVDLFSPGVFGMHFVHSIDENGGLLKFANLSWLPFPAYPATNIPTVSGMAVARINADERDDLVVATNSGAVQILLNSGSHQLSPQSFAPGVPVDFFGPSFTANPPFIRLMFPHVRVIDINGDQIKDIIVAGSPIDVWTGTTLPGVVKLYLGTPSGAYQTHSLSLPGNVIDMEWADLDRNGTQDQLVIVTETGSVGAFLYELHHAKFDVTNQFHFTNPPQILPMRVTSLELGDLVGDSNNDYVLTLTNWTGSSLTSSVYYAQGDGLGNISQTSWGFLYLPPNSTGLGDSILSAKIRDFNGDGNDDIVIARNYSTPPPWTSSLPTQYSDSELLVGTGPNLAFAQFTTQSVGGYIMDSWSANLNARYLPIFPGPDHIQLIDLNANRQLDLLFPMLITATSATSNTSGMTTFKNQTPTEFGDPAVDKYESPSGGTLSAPIRQGFEGAPVLGNATFAATISGSNLQNGGIWGLTWSPILLPSWNQAYGFNWHIVPTEFSSPIPMTNGFARFQMSIPNSPSLLGPIGYFQSVVYNPGTGLFSGSQATGITIGNP